MSDQRLMAKFRHYTAPLGSQRTEQIATTFMEPAATSARDLLTLLTDPL